MFLLESEISDAAEAFAVKFSDIGKRRRVVFGPDQFATMKVERPAQIRRLRQVLLNLILRLRRALALGAIGGADLSGVAANAAGPLRVAATTLRDLTSQPPLAPREALAAFVDDERIPGGDQVVARISEARDHPLGDGAAQATIVGMIGLADALRRKAAALREDGR
jgi:hypothetical protein